MASVSYRLSSIVSNGRSEVLVRFYAGKFFSQRAKGRVYVPIEYWDVESGRLAIPKKVSVEVANLRELQANLDRMTDEIYNRWMSDQYDATDGWLQVVIDEFHEIKKKEKVGRRTLANIVDEYTNTAKIAESTKRVYDVIRRAIDRFGEKEYIIYADTLCGKDIQAFVDFLTEEDTVNKDGERVTIVRGVNTIATKMKKLRAACNWAANNEYIEASPFGDKKGQYQIEKEVYGDPTFLYKEERDALYAFQGLPPYLERQRDVFIFQCHVGCRVSDLLLLTRKNITEDGFLQYIPTKTIGVKANVVKVPLSETALAIIEKYNDLPDGKLLPFISSYKYGKYVHDVLERAGLNRNVIVLNPKTRQPEIKPLFEVACTHIARRTFAEIVFKETKSEMITSSLTGHSENSHAFKRYAKVDDDMKMDVIKSVNKK